MNMQDYRHAADRVHIADHCEEEVLRMTTQTEQKTRRPVLRAVTGIAAAAACIGVTGALGLALFHMNRDGSELTAASQDETAVVSEATETAGTDSVQAEPVGETYEDFVSAYYEKIAGHPVNYDWSSLCGTNLNEVWESEDGTLTLKAAVTDGYQAQFFYTFRPDFDWDHADEEERSSRLPRITFGPDTTPTVQLDETVRGDGTIRFYCCLRSIMKAELLPEDGICSAFFVPSYRADEKSYSSSRESRTVTINMPEQMPQWRELSDTLHLVNDGTALSTDVLEADYSYVLVTPLCAYLTDCLPAEQLAICEKAKHNFGGIGNPVYAGSASADALTLQGDRISVPLNLIESSDVFYGDSAYQFIAEEYQEGRDPGDGKLYSICLLRFKEPQDLSEVAAMTFASPADGTAVTVDLTPEKLSPSDELDPDTAEINRVSEPETTAPQEATETTAAADDIPELRLDRAKLRDEIAAKLEALPWSQDISAGPPECIMMMPDGTGYSFNLTEGWVWKDDHETLKQAWLTEELIKLLNSF